MELMKFVEDAQSVQLVALNESIMNNQSRLNYLLENFPLTADEMDVNRWEMKHQDILRDLI